MAECVYRRQGQSFKSFLVITANPGDTVTITATDSRGIPEEYQSPFTMGDAGKLTIVVKKKGDYTVSGSESGITKTVSITKRRVDNEADVSFINTVTVNANPGATITLSNYGDVTRVYSAEADSNGVATVTVKRKGSFTITTSTSSSGTELSTSPASASTVECSTDDAKLTVNHVRVTTPTAYASGAYSMANKQFYTYMERSNDVAASGYRIQCKVNSSPSSLTDGTNVGDDGFGTSRALKSDLTKESFLGTGTIGSTHYFRGAVYIIINGIKYYGSQKTWSFAFSNTAVSNQVRTAGGSFVVPDGCRTLDFALVGGGGGGDGNYKSSYYSGGGGGAGYMTRGSWTVTPGQTVYFSVGSGGTAGHRADASSYIYKPGDGGQSKIWTDGKSATANGGNGAGYAHSGYNENGADGGSGGGHGGYSPNSGDGFSSYSGGSDGCAAGKTNTSSDPATGTGTGDYGSPRNGSGQGYWSGSTWVGTTYNGVAYCKGGNGGTMSMGWNYGSTGATGSGDGGGGGGRADGGDQNNYGGAGGSGAVIYSLS